jgi:hypothetical protein
MLAPATPPELLIPPARPTLTHHSCNAQPRPLLDAATALARARHQLRRRGARQHDDVHVRGERGAAGDAGAHAGHGDDFPAGEHAYDDEHGYVSVLSHRLPWSFDGTLGLHACDLEARAAGVGATGTDHTPTPSFELTKPTFIYTAANYHTGCENAQLVSALDSDDPGTLNVGQVFANGFPFELINAAFGQELASDVVKSKMTPVGTGSNWGPESCLERCGITKPGA